MKKLHCIICTSCKKVLTKQIKSDILYCENCNLIFEDRTLTALGSCINSSIKGKL